MPFIIPKRREIIDEYGGLEALLRLGGSENYIQPGDRCYVFYKEMVRRWEESPRWTTAHNIFKDLIKVHEDVSEDDYCAAVLAWEVFFQLYVMPYELKKREENGDI